MRALDSGEARRYPFMKSVDTTGEEVLRKLPPQVDE
jgi:hypothetical protein